MIGTLWSRCRNYLYDAQYLHAEPGPCFVISIGNLTWGGTGKTALTAQLGRQLLWAGYRLAIVSRGYGRSTRGLLQVSDGRTVQVGWEQAGDECWWLAASLCGARVYAAADRALAFRALAQDPPDVILLDDAFQHRRVMRDLDIVLVDASEDLTAQRVIPFGKLREPPASLNRADVVVLTHWQAANPRTSAWITGFVRVPVFHARYMPKSTPWSGKPVAAFCGLGSPRHFFAMLRETGAQVVLERAFKDHHRYSLQDMESLTRAAAAAGAEALVTTEKDAVKIERRQWPLPLISAQAELKIEEPGFLQMVLDRIREKR